MKYSILLFLISSSFSAEKLYASNNYLGFANILMPANLDEVEDCITNSNISLSMMTIEKHDIYDNT